MYTYCELCRDLEQVVPVSLNKLHWVNSRRLRYTELQVFVLYIDKTPVRDLCGVVCSCGESVEVFKNNVVKRSLVDVYTIESVFRVSLRVEVFVDKADKRSIPRGEYCTRAAVHTDTVLVQECSELVESSFDTCLTKGRSHKVVVGGSGTVYGVSIVEERETVSSESCY